MLSALARFDRPNMMVNHLESHLIEALDRLVGGEA